nr:DUF126 domain-containing protein [Acuticoccus mangrovi]
MTADTLFAGTASGAFLPLTAPLSFWGGVDPATGRIINGRHPQRGVSLAGRVVAIPDLIGSSSSSSVMLELVHAGLAPAAVLLTKVDAILVVGCLVAREMGLSAPPVIRRDTWDGLPEAAVLAIVAGAEGATIRPA